MKQLLWNSMIPIVSKHFVPKTPLNKLWDCFLWRSTTISSIKLLFLTIYWIQKRKWKQWKEFLVSIESFSFILNDMVLLSSCLIKRHSHDYIKFLQVQQLYLPDINIAASKNQFFHSLCYWKWKLKEPHTNYPWHSVVNLTFLWNPLPLIFNWTRWMIQK